MRYINVLKRASGAYLYSDGVVTVQPGDKIYKISVEFPGHHTIQTFIEHGIRYDNWVVETNGVPQKAFMFRDDAQEWKCDFEEQGVVRRLYIKK